MGKIVLLLVEPESYQTDIAKIIEQVADGSRMTLILCMNSSPDYMLQNMDLVIREKIAKEKNVFFLDGVSHNPLPMENYTFVEGRSETMVIQVKDSLRKLLPDYFIMDSVDQLVDEKIGKLVMEDIINELKKLKVNSILFAGSDKGGIDLVNDVKRIVEETKYYKDFKKEAAEWNR